MSAGIETETGETSSGTLALETRSETERGRLRERKCGRHGVGSGTLGSDAGAGEVTGNGTGAGAPSEGW